MPNFSSSRERECTRTAKIGPDLRLVQWQTVPINRLMSLLTLKKNLFTHLCQPTQKCFSNCSVIWVTRLKMFMSCSPTCVSDLKQR